MSYGNPKIDKSDWHPHAAQKLGELGREILSSALQSEDEVRYEIARRSRAARQHRVELFGSAIARELPWDILLLLYVHHERARLKISSIFAEVGSPPTTVLRWLKRLDAKGFIVREPHPSDQRIVFVRLSRAGKCTLDLYFGAMLPVHEPTS